MLLEMIGGSMIHSFDISSLSVVFTFELDYISFTLDIYHASLRYLYILILIKRYEFYVR